MSFFKYTKTFLITGVVLCLVSTLLVNAQDDNNQNIPDNFNNQSDSNQIENSESGSKLGNNNTGNQSRSSRSRSSRSRTRDGSTQNADGKNSNIPAQGMGPRSRPGLSRPGAAMPRPVSGSSSTGSGSGRKYLAKSKPLLTTRPTANLYLDGDSPVGVINEPKVIKILIDNKAQLKFDRVSLVIKYNPDDLVISTGKDASGTLIKAESIALTSEPALDTPGESKINNVKEETLISANQSNLQIVENRIDAENGLIYLDIKTQKEPIAWNGLVAQFTCIPIHVTNTNLSFIFVNPEKRDPAKEPLTSLSLSEKDQLGSRFSAADGIINLDLLIFESRDKAKKSSLITKVGDEESSDDSQTENASLILIPRQSQVNVGDIMEIDVYLKNPGKKVFDSIGLLIAYNTRIFEPVDGEKADSGINIEDKKYKNNFSLDFPILNVIDKEKGIIDYRKKAMRKPVRSEGVFATVRLRAIKPTKKTTFRMFISSKGEEPTTGVFYRLQDRLGNSSDPFDGVETCSVGVRPTTAYLSKLN